MVTDTKNRVVDIGDTVEIISLPDRLLDGLPEVERAFLAASVGRLAVMDESIGNSEAMVSLRDGSSGIVHFVRLSGRNFRKQN